MALISFSVVWDEIVLQPWISCRMQVHLNHFCLAPTAEAHHHKVKATKVYSPVEQKNRLKEKRVREAATLCLNRFKLKRWVSHCSRRVFLKIPATTKKAKRLMCLTADTLPLCKRLYKQKDRQTMRERQTQRSRYPTHCNCSHVSVLWVQAHPVSASTLNLGPTL